MADISVIEVSIGPPGPAGVGVPAGGTTGQVIAKASSEDYDTVWVEQTGGGSDGFPKHLGYMGVF